MYTDIHWIVLMSSKLKISLFGMTSLIGMDGSPIQRIGGL